MNQQQLQAATESMAAWLAEPANLGKRPGKLECTGEFDLNDLHYYIFRFKKSLLGGWLLGVCGGYEADATAHCGHVYSDMQAHDPATAREAGIELVQRAAQAQERQREGGPFVSFVLLRSAEWDKQQFIRTLQETWDLTLDTSEGDGEEDPDRLVTDVDGMMVAISLMPAPVPNGEAEHNAATNYLWPEAVETTRQHKAHLLIAVLQRDGSLYDAGRLLTKLNHIALLSDNALGVYTSGTVFQPSFYCEAAELMKNHPCPVLNWVYFGLRRTEQGNMNGYTYGLNAFAKDEIEVLETTATPQELRDFLLDIATYILSNDVTLLDGETIGFSAEEKLTITRSPGVCLGDETLKIGWRAAGA